MDGIPPGDREGIVKGGPKQGLCGAPPFCVLARNSEKSEKEEQIA
jgi:hypothetical protein